MNNTRRSVCKTNKVNVSDLAKIICGLDTKKNVKSMTDNYAVDKYTEIFIPMGWNVRG